MNGATPSQLLARLWLLVVGMVAIAVLYLAKVLFLPLAFATLFAFLLAPVVGLLERIRLPRPMAAMLVILGFAALLGAAGWMLFSQFVGIANDLPTYRDNIEQKMRTIHAPSNSAFSRAEREMERLSAEIGLANSSSATPALAQAAKNSARPLGTPEHPVQVREVARPTGRLDQLGGILEPLTTASLSVVFTFFVLLQREDLRNRLIRLSGDRNLSVMTQAMDDASGRISRYFSLQLFVNLIFGTVIFLALYFIGLPHALLFGALAALCRFVPYIGTPIAAAAPTLLSLAVFRGWEHSLLIAGTFLVVELVTANYAEPHLYGHHTGLSSLAILIAASFWTLLWGPVGLILSVPLTVCLVVMGRHVPSLEFLTVMLGDRPTIPQWMCLYQRLLARDEREAGEILERQVAEQPLPQVYDSVVIPALVMSEEDRLHRDLDRESVHYIRQTARELVEELGFREAPEPEEAAEPGLSVPAIQALCIPVRDELDEVTGIMLAQCLDGGRIAATSLPPMRVEDTAAAAAARNPDLVILCILAPTAASRTRRLYQVLRSRMPRTRFMLGLWNFPGDAREVAQKVSRGAEIRVVTRLSEAVAEVRAMTSTGSDMQAKTHRGLLANQTAA